MRIGRKLYPFSVKWPPSWISQNTQGCGDHTHRILNKDPVDGQNPLKTHMYHIFPRQTLICLDNFKPEHVHFEFSYYKIERPNFRTGHRNAPKFCTHVRIDTLTLKTLKKMDQPHPRGVKRAYTCGDVGVCLCVCLCVCVCLWLAAVYASLTPYLFRYTTVGPSPNLARMCG